MSRGCKAVQSLSIHDRRVFPVKHDHLCKIYMISASIGSILMII